jgi:LPS-assembly lipoprotein
MRGMNERMSASKAVLFPASDRSAAADRRAGGAGGERPVDGGRRTLLLAGACALMLSACGFELRRAPALQFTTIQLRGFGRRSEMEDELRRNINASTTSHVVESAGDAQVVLETQVDAREKVVVASTASGQVREVTLRNRFTFRVRTPSGTELIPSTEILLTRDMSYNETYALAKEQEETVLYRAMQSDIVAQVMRRLAALRPPA